MRRQTIIVTLPILLVFVISGAMLLFLRNPGPPPIVDGNLSARDISQIQRAVRLQLWRETFPNLSVRTLKSLRANIHMAFTTRVTYIGAGPPNRAGLPNLAYATCGTNQPPSGFVVTNGPSGWRFQSRYILYD